MSADWPDLTIPEAVRRLSARATLLEDTAEMLDALADRLDDQSAAGMAPVVRSWSAELRRIAGLCSRMASAAADRDLPQA